jgi:hypothetical protein
MLITAGQIYRAKKVKLGKVEYARPLLVLRVMQTDADICYLSTKFDLIEPDDLTPNELDADFAATGLDETSYLIFHSIDTEPLEFFRNTKLLGEIRGYVRKQGEDWWGAPLK